MASPRRPFGAINPHDEGLYFQNFHNPWSVRSAAAPTAEPCSRPPPHDAKGNCYSLILLQEPTLWRASASAVPVAEQGGKAQSGKAVKKRCVQKDTNNALEPPVALEWSDNGRAVIDPHVFCVATVQSLDPRYPAKIDTLVGCTSSSLQKLKHAQGDQSIFAFPSLGIRYPGRYILKFVVYKFHVGNGVDEESGGNFRVPYVEQIAEIYGSELLISTDKNAAYAKLSTPFTKNMRESGVKVRTRKEPRKRKSPTTNWTADCYPPNSGPFPYSATYMALPGHNGPMPHLTNGEDISRRISYQGMSSSAPMHIQTQYTTSMTTQPQYTTSVPAPHQYTTTMVTQPQYTTVMTTQPQYTTAMTTQTQYTTAMDTQTQYTTAMDTQPQYTTAMGTQPQYTTAMDTKSQYTTAMDTKSQYTTAMPFILPAMQQNAEPYQVAARSQTYWPHNEVNGNNVNDNGVDNHDVVKKEDSKHQPGWAS